MQHAEPRIGSQYIGQWNWGAFLLSGIWLIWHRRVSLAIWFWVFWIAPFVFFIAVAAIATLGLYGLNEENSLEPLFWTFMLSRLAFFVWWLWISILLGRNGNKIATERDFTSEAQFVTVEQRWTTWGFLLWGIGIAFCIVVGFHFFSTPPE